MALAYGLTRYAAPATEPLTLVEAKKQVEIPNAYTAHDDHLQRLIASARGRIESLTGRQIVTSTWDLTMDAFPDDSDDVIYIPKPPLQSVSAITYVDSSGVTQTWSSSNYVVSTSREPGCVRPAYAQAYPTDVRIQPDCVKVRFVAGYGAITAIPEDLKAAMLLLIGHWFDHRESVITGSTATSLPQAVEALCEQYLVGDEFIKYGSDEFSEA